MRSRRKPREVTDRRIGNKGFRRKVAMHASLALITNKKEKTNWENRFRMLQKIYSNRDGHWPVSAETNSRAECRSRALENNKNKSVRNRTYKRPHCDTYYAVWSSHWITLLLAPFASWKLWIIIWVAHAQRGKVRVHVLSVLSKITCYMVFHLSQRAVQYFLVLKHLRTL